MGIPIQVGQIDANSPAYVCFLDQDYNCYPLWVLRFYDKSNFKKLIHLDVDNHVALGIECLALMLDGLEFRVDIETVDDYARTYPRYVLV